MPTVLGSCCNCSSGCDNFQLCQPEFLCKVVGAGRFGGIQPLPNWVEFYVGTGLSLQPAIDFWNAARPTGVNNTVYQQMDFIGRHSNFDGSIARIHYTWRWHPVMGDMYWMTIEADDPDATPSHFFYDWQVDSEGMLHIINSVNPGVDNGRSGMPAWGFDQPVIQDYSVNHMLISDAGDPGLSAEWTLSQPYQMQDAVAAAQGFCDQLDILSDNITHIIEGVPGTATSNLTCWASPVEGDRSALLVRCAARRPGRGVVSVTRNLGDAGEPFQGYGLAWDCIVAGNLCTEFGGVAGTNRTSDLFGRFNVVFTGEEWTTYAIKSKFAFHTPSWCLQKWQLQTCAKGALVCDGIEGSSPTFKCVDGHYNTQDLRWVFYKAADFPPSDGSPCPSGFIVSNPWDWVIRASLVECSAVEGALQAGAVSDLPQPCVNTGSCSHICQGPFWYFNYTDAPLFGWMTADGSSCGSDCHCEVTTRDLFIIMPPTPE